MENRNQLSENFWKRTLSKGYQEAGDFKLAQNLLMKDGSLEKTRLEAIKWSNIAKGQLKLLPNGKINKVLNRLTDYVVARIS